LKRCVEALQQQQTYSDHEILVVYSEDDTEVAGVVAEFPKVRAIVSPTPLFAGDARNLGVENALADTLVFTDADCIAHPAWLDAAVGALEADGAVAVGGPVGDVRPFHPISAADNAMQFIDFSRRRSDAPASYLASCNLAIDRATFEAVGGFPVGVKIGEDVVLCDKVAKHAADGVRFVQAMQVRHKGRGTISEFWRHHKEFGYHRGLLGLRLRPGFQELGKSTLFAGILAIGRLQYYLKSTLRWNKRGLLRLAILSPLILLGLGAWGLGFRDGCRKYAEQQR